jgi:hypothetical protein
MRFFSRLGFFPIINNMLLNSIRSSYYPTTIVSLHFGMDLVDTMVSSHLT